MPYWGPMPEEEMVEDTVEEEPKGLLSRETHEHI